MNIGGTRWNNKYICDKCKTTIYYQPQKGFEGLNKYYKQKPSSNPIKKNFDLCDSCEKKFREWLNTREIPTTKDIINRFPIYEGEEK